jgi:hypothetical protein
MWATICILSDIEVKLWAKCTLRSPELRPRPHESSYAMSKNFSCCFQSSSAAAHMLRSPKVTVIVLVVASHCVEVTCAECSRRMTGWMKPETCTVAKDRISGKAARCSAVQRLGHEQEFLCPTVWVVVVHGQAFPTHDMAEIGTVGVRVNGGVQCMGLPSERYIPSHRSRHRQEAISSEKECVSHGGEY